MGRKGKRKDDDFPDLPGADEDSEMSAQTVETPVNVKKPKGKGKKGKAAFADDDDASSSARPSKDGDGASDGEDAAAGEVNHTSQRPLWVRWRTFGFPPPPFIRVMHAWLYL
jgi:hypothetical protein